MRRDLRRLRRDIERAGVAPALLHTAADIVADRATLLRRTAYLKQTKAVFDLWHVFHLPLVYVMFLTSRCTSRSRRTWGICRLGTRVRTRMASMLALGGLLLATIAVRSERAASAEQLGSPVSPGRLTKAHAGVEVLMAR
jgi:hypothetical protein